jgi:hypothetical protein
VVVKDSMVEFKFSRMVVKDSMVEFKFSRTFSLAASFLFILSLILALPKKRSLMEG